MNILSIGNSFSDDAHFYLKKVAESAGVELTCVNLFIGGCSLEEHAQNLENSRLYSYQLNGVFRESGSTLIAALCEREWDVVTIQQVSGLSGLIDTYYPYVDQLIDCIKEHAPYAKIMFHKTWAYEIGSDHPDFSLYNSDQAQMYSAICGATDAFCEAHPDVEVIPSGDVIQALRCMPEFDVSRGGITLCRDGYHMDLIYGRFALACTWFEKVCGGNALEVAFVPSKIDFEVLGDAAPECVDIDEGKLEIICDCVHSICAC